MGRHLFFWPFKSKYFHHGDTVMLNIFVDIPDTNVARYRVLPKNILNSILNSDDQLVWPRCSRALVRIDVQHQNLVTHSRNSILVWLARY
jgi:hypothetical protein